MKYRHLFLKAAHGLIEGTAAFGQLLNRFDEPAVDVRLLGRQHIHVSTLEIVEQLLLEPSFGAREAAFANVKVVARQRLAHVRLGDGDLGRFEKWSDAAGQAVVMGVVADVDGQS